MKYRAAIIGCGRITEQGYAPALKYLSGKVQIAALAGHKNVERLKLIGGLFGVPKEHWYLDYKQMLKNEKLDFAVISLPHYLHRQAAVDCANSKLDIVLDKPMAVSLAEAERILKAVKRNKVRCCMLHNNLYNDRYLKAMKLIKAGRIGKPFLFRQESLWYGYYSGAKGNDPAWRTKFAKSGGGVFIDAGWHSVYLAEALIKSPVKKVFAKLETYGGKIDVDDTALVLLSHANGALSSIQLSWSVRKSLGVNEVYGNKATLRIGSSDKMEILYGKDRIKTVKVDLKAWSFNDIFEDFIENGSYPDADDGYRIQRIVSAAYESSRTGKEIII